MFENTQVLRILPDQAGKGGSKTALTTFEQNVDTRIVNDMIVYLGRWRTMSQAVAYPGLFTSSNALRSYSLHNYLAYDTGNAATLGTSAVMSHTEDAPTNSHCIFNHTKGFTYRCGKTTPNSFTPAVFVNIKNRCFICWGGDNNFIVSDPTLTFSDPAKVYDVGVNPPATPPTYNLTGFIDEGTPGLGQYITYTNGSNKVNAISTNIILSPPPLLGLVPAISIGGVVYNVQQPNGYINNTFPAIGIHNISGTGGTPTVTVHGFLFPPNGDYNGLFMNITDGVGGNETTNTLIIASYTLGATDTTVTLASNLAHTHLVANTTATVNGEQLILTQAYQGASTTAGNGLIRLFSGALSWTGPGPQYAYAYYDPVSGHVSNISPTLQITENDQTGVGVRLTNIQPSVSTDQTRFTQIIIFRTLLSGGAVLFPISTSFVPGNFEHVANTPGAKTYDDSNPDSALLVAGGLQAPLTTNNKPSPFYAQAYWDGRLWGIPVDDPSSVVFSGDVVQVPFGIPEESFPSKNQLRITADDGRGVGMKLFGSTLVITTERYSYFVDGNNELNYRLTRFGSGTFGVGTYQMVELPGDTSELSSAILYLSPDSTLYLAAPQYGNVSVSDPVADLLKTAVGVDDSNYHLCAVHYFPAQAQRLAMISLPPYVNESNGKVVAYDFARKIWVQGNPASPAILRPDAWATLYGGIRPIDLVFIDGGQVFSWMRNDDNLQGAFNPYIELPVLDFGMPKVRKQLHFVRAYTNAPSFSLQVWPNEGPVAMVQAGSTEPDPLRSIYAPGASPVDDVNARELVAFPAAASSAGDPVVLFAYRYRIRVNLPQDGTRYDVYAIEVGWAPLEQPTEPEG